MTTSFNTVVKNALTKYLRHEREDAINVLYGIRADNLNLDDAYTKDKYNALTIAIKELEQEPTRDVIDKIKEEIKQLSDQSIFGNVSNYSLLDTVIEIIDKYRKEV